MAPCIRASAITEYACEEMNIDLHCKELFVVRNIHFPLIYGVYLGVLKHFIITATVNFGDWRRNFVNEDTHKLAVKGCRSD